MNPGDQERHSQRAAVFVALLMFSLVLIVLQLWLFVAALENLLAGKISTALPGAGISLVCLGVNVWMLLGIYRMEK